MLQGRHRRQRFPDRAGLLRWRRWTLLLAIGQIDFPDASVGCARPSVAHSRGLTMKARMLALAGVALFALAGPAAASDAQGWYLDIGAGWDHLGRIEVPQDPLLDSTGHKIDKINTGNSALIEGSVGYRFPDRIRAEFEFGYTHHDVDSTDATSGGKAEILSFLYNLGYDLPITDRWDFSFGAGAGIGSVPIDIPLVGGGHLATGVNHGFMWQAMAAFD